MGALRRLSVAVVVNDRPGVDEEGNAILEPVPEDELGEITRLVQQAVGFSTERGDQVEVINSPFKPIVIEEPEPLAWWKDPMVIDIATTSLRYALAGLLILIGYRVIVRPLMRKHLGVTFISKDEAQMALPGGGAGYIDSGQSTSVDSDAGDGRPKAIPFSREDRSASYSEQLAELKKISQDDPRMIAMIVRNWLKADA
jgi:flagellar M-ring protein FliF